jgi:DNA-binding YbaB/EbfC family protein
MAGNPFELLKNLQSIQSRMNEIQERMAQIRVTGSSGGDMVRIEMTGTLSVTRVTIAREAVDPNDIDMLQDLVLAAFSDALAKVKERMKDEASSMTGGLDLPPGILGG